MKRGETALMKAAKNGKLEIVSELISAKAAINMTNKVSDT